MNPVRQAILVDPATPKIRGDCFRACIASILELSSEEVPHFVQIEHDWWGEVRRWLAERGLAAIWIRIDPEELTFCHPCADTWCILTGPSPRGNFQHSVVGKISDGWNFEIAYDPHPSGDGLAGPATSALFFLANPDRAT